MSLVERLDQVHQQIAAACRAVGRDPAEVRLLPVSKRHELATIQAALDCGVTVFGENRVQELASKSSAMADRGISWHMIGSLQTNKVQQLLKVPGLVLLQTMDRIKLADALQSAAYREGLELEVLLQIHATDEAHKHGVAPGDAPALLSHMLSDCPSLRLSGLMAMGPLGADPAPVFQRVANLREQLRDQSGLALPILSMGMTGDMAAAIASGSTMVRVGTGVFGPRPAVG